MNTFKAGTPTRLMAALRHCEAPARGESFSSSDREATMAEIGTGDVAKDELSGASGIVWLIIGKTGENR